MAPSAPFLKTLAETLFDGTLVPGFAGNVDPLRFADVTLFLPTRRAAATFAEILAERTGGTAVLPRIRPLGDVDDGDVLLGEEEAAADRLLLPAAIDPLQRRLILTRLILAWRDAAGRDVAGHRLDAIAVPASSADAVRLADKLARLMDDAEIEGIDWAALKTLVPEDYAGYWQITLEFLKIATEAWPAHLAETGRADPIARRNRLIRAEARRLTESPPPGPVIAAGSTGSIPATADLLAAIARLRSGAVVLPGFDHSLDEAAIAAIRGDEDEEAAFSHPQFGLIRLIERLGLQPEEIALLGARPTPQQAARTAFVAKAMRPAALTDIWAASPDDAGASDGIDLIEAANEREEALAIAIALRETIETPDRTAALVTPNRGLARRVVTELERWQVPVDDSAGIALIDTPAAVFARLAAEAALHGAQPVTVLSLLKHPFAALGRDRVETGRLAGELELLLMRGPRPRPGTAGLAESLGDQRRAVAEKAVRQPAVAERLDVSAWDGAAALVADLGTALQDLERLADTAEAVALAELVDAHLSVLDRLAADADGDAKRLWGDEAGRVLATLLDGAAGTGPLAPALRPRDYPAFLDALISGVAVRRPPRTAPRVHIYGQLEARLQHMDCVVLGGLNEGGWPAETRTDPWLSRAMRRAIGLEPPERRIGLAAHDFCQALGIDKVVLSRAVREGGAPSVASRFLQRLTTLAGEAATKAMTARGRRYLDLARAIDAPEGPLRPAVRPAPTPPLKARPRRLSVTAIEELIRDPYAIYARHVLGLEPLDPVDAMPDFADRGSLVHDALARFTADWRGPFDGAALARLLQIGETVFEAIAAFPELHALWWPRFRRLARYVVLDWEAGRADDVAKRHAEVDGTLVLPGAADAFRLTARADRIDELADGRLAILDYKTGTPPTAKQVMSGLAPQLALEAAIARAGGFEGVAGGRAIGELAWIAVTGGFPPGYRKSAVDKGESADAIADDALRRVTALIAAYDDPKRGYVSRARPMFLTRAGRFDHLARVAEWSAQPSSEAGP